MNPKLRPQYHFRRTQTGLDAWNVARLIRLSRDLPALWVDPCTISELDQNHWYMGPSQQPTPRSLLEHMQLIERSDLSFPIILDASGRVMDGMHRVCKAVYEGRSAISARQFSQDPAPDYVNCTPDELPYVQSLFSI